MKAKITEQVNGYLVEWPEANIEAKVSRLHIHSDGHVTGMLAISHNNGRIMRLLPNTQFNFSSDPTRAKQAKQLAEKYSDINCEWMEIFDYLGEAVQDAALKGSVSVEVYADEESEAPPLLVDPIVYKGHQNIIFGEKGVAKSTFSYCLAACMILPEWENPLELKINGDYIKTLVLDWETDEPTFRWYMGRLKRGMNFGPVPIYYRHCKLPLAQIIEEVAEDIVKNGIQHIIIDSLAAAAGTENLKDAASALDFNAAFRRLPGMTATIIGQTSKEKDTGTGTAKTIYGSTFFRYYARNIFEIYRGKDDGDVQLIGLRHTDCNFNRKHAPMAFQFTYGDQKSIAIKRVPYNALDFAETASVADRVYQLLKTGYMENQELAAELPDVSEDAIRQAIKRLKDGGKIVKQAGGNKWGIVQKIE